MASLGHEAAAEPVVVQGAGHPQPDLGFTGSADAELQREAQVVVLTPGVGGHLPLGGTEPFGFAALGQLQVVVPVPPMQHRLLVGSPQNVQSVVAEGIQ